MRISAGSIAASLGAMAILLAPALGRAELQRVEAVGIYGIRDAMRSRVIPRDEAIAKARWEGVSRVALELIRESAPSEVSGPTREALPEPRGGERVIPPLEVPLAKGPGELPGPSRSDGPSEDQIAALRTALGDDVLPYMRSYRILDDRGEVPVLFNDQPDVVVEYVVVVEVIVDVDRITGALEAAGLITALNPQEPGEAVFVELIGLSRYEGFEIILEALQQQFGAMRVRTIEFSRKRQILAVEGPLGPAALSAELGRFENPRLLLEPIGVDLARRRIRLIGRWFPEPDASEDAPTSESNGAAVPRSGHSAHFQYSGNVGLKRIDTCILKG